MRFECNKNDKVIKKRKTKAKTGPKHRQWQNDEDAEQCPQEIYFLPIKKYLPFKSGVPTNFWLPQPRVITFLSKTHCFLSHSRCRNERKIDRWIGIFDPSAWQGTQRYLNLLPDILQLDPVGRSNVLKPAFQLFYALPLKMALWTGRVRAGDVCLSA